MEVCCYECSYVAGNYGQLGRVVVLRDDYEMQGHAAIVRIRPLLEIRRLVRWPQGLRCR